MTREEIKAVCCNRRTESFKPQNTENNQFGKGSMSYLTQNHFQFQNGFAWPRQVLSSQIPTFL
jgi:hypothetical protein